MKRKVVAILAGLIVWVVIAAVAGLIIRATWSEYVAVSESLAFTLPMKIVRLSIGAIATVGAGWVVAYIARRSTFATLTTGVILLAFFIPDHIALWNKFPLWYHLTFLLALVPLSYLGGKLPAPSLAPDQQTA
jgi:hypothetical protein